MSIKETILIDSTYFYSLLADIQAAKYAIDLEVYIFNEGVAGMQLSKALRDAANRGVKVRVHVDGIGTPEWGSTFSIEMKESGVKTKIYHPVPWIVLQWRYFHDSLRLLSQINSRNHRKVCIIDRQIVYVGSANITDHLLGGNQEKVWRDTSVRLVGVEVEALQYAFEKAWGHLPLKKRFYAIFNRANADPIFRLNYSWRLRHVLYRAMLNRIRRCEKRIWMASAYFVPESRLLRQLIAARKRGIDIRVLLPSRSDVFIESLAAKTFYSVLLKAGILIYEYLPSVLHEKMLILDDWYLVGSSNLNYRSIKHDLEVDVKIQSHEAKKVLEDQYLVDLSHAHKINLKDIIKQPSYQYVLGRIILLIRYWI